jgi:hypothetical protein
MHRSSSPAGFLGWDAVGLCAGIYLFVRGFQLLQRRRLILDTPFSKIRSASMGMVEVNGLAVGPYTIAAPITERACYYYRIQVWEWKQRGKNKQWVQVAGESVHVPFFVDDNSGRVLVDPRGAELDLHRDFQQEFCDSFFTTKDPAPPNVRTFLAAHGIATRNKIKVEECCIKPKNSLFILGTLTENPGLEVTPDAMRENETVASSTVHLSLGTSGFSLSRASAVTDFGSAPVTQTFTVQSTTTAPAVRPSLAAPPSKSTDMSQQQRIAAALAKAGISNPAALKAAGLAHPTLEVTSDPSLMSTLSATKREVSSGRAAASSDFDLHPPTVLMKGANDKTFMISWRSQQEVARSLGWKCTLMIWGGGALTLLSLYILINVIKLL